MITNVGAKRLSKFLSYVLRHNPSQLGIELDANGWTDVQVLLTRWKIQEPLIDLDTLKYIVDTNSKKRFSFNDDGTMIRANQGHSVEIELGYTPQRPPEFLYHGTAEQNLPGIRECGLNKRDRHHVHLSVDKATAHQVGSRHGKAVILTIRAREMHAAGHEFYLSANGVWLTESVRTEYIN